MQTVKKPRNYYKLATLILVAVIVLSAFLFLYKFTIIDKPVYGSYTSLGIQLTPDNHAVKLSPNETYNLTYHMTNGTAPYVATWTLNPTGNFSLLVNGNLVSFNGSSQSFQSDELTVCYPNATDQYITVDLTVKDANGFTGSLLLPITIADPYTAPTQTLNSANVASFSYKIEADGLGWYRAISGLDGSIAFTSTNATSLLVNAISASPTYGIIVITGSMSLDSYITINQPITIIGNNNLLTWTQAAIDGFYITSSNVTIKNVHINGGGLVQLGITLQDSSNSLIINCEVYNCINYGIVALSPTKASNNNEISFNYIHDLIGAGWGVDPESSGGYGTGIKLGTGNGDYGGVGDIISHNNIDTVPEHGIKCYTPNSDCIISENTIGVTGPIGATGITAEGIGDRVVNNIVNNTGVTKSSGGGMGISVGITNAYSYSYVSGNIISNQTGSNQYGIAVWGSNSTVTNNQIVNYKQVYTFTTQIMILSLVIQLSMQLQDFGLRRGLHTIF